jgi:hypothetical protein
MKLEYIRETVKKLRIFQKPSLEAISKIIFAMAKVKKLRITCLAEALPGLPTSNQKYITRNLNKLDETDLQDALVSFSNAKEKHLLMDFTDMERLNAEKTDYVGILKDGESRGYSIFSLGEGFKGRVKVVFSKILSSKIINDSTSGKWMIIQQWMNGILSFLKTKIIVADREFCNETMLSYLSDNEIRYSIRLKQGAGKHSVRITNIRGNDVDIALKPGQKKYWRNIFYKGKVWANLAGEWTKGCSKPMYIITNYSPKEALKAYKKRMKIEQGFRDIKDKLGFVKLMCKSKSILLKLILIGLIGYNIFISVGESLRNAKIPRKHRHKFSGLHVLFSMTHRYTPADLRKAFCQLQSFVLEVADTIKIFLQGFRRC